MKSRIFLMLIFLSVLICSCDTESALKRSVFIEDEANPGLPMYSEWGYNTFGAYFDREPFTSNYIDAPGKFIVENGATTFLLDGGRNSGDLVSLRFVIPSFSPNTYHDLADLDDTTFDLVTSGVEVTMTRNGLATSIEILEGELKFKRVQTLLVDGTAHEVILSGYFDLRIVVDDVPVSISDGRFDLGINEDAFFLLD